MGKRSTTVMDSSTRLPPEFSPYYTNIFQQAQNAASRVNTSPYGGEFLAPADPWQVQGQNARYAAAAGLPDDAGARLVQLGQDTAAGKYLTPESNPFLRSAIDAATRPITQNYQENTIGGINDAARRAGAFGGVRRDVVQQQGFRDYNRNVGDISAGMALGNYTGERQNQINAGNIINQGFQISQLKPSLIESAGADRQALAQNALDNLLAKFEDANTAPFRGINQQLPVLGLNVGMDTTGKSKARNYMFGV